MVESGWPTYGGKQEINNYCWNEINTSEQSTEDFFLCEYIMDVKHINQLEELTLYTS